MTTSDTFTLTLAREGPQAPTLAPEGGTPSPEIAEHAFNGAKGAKPDFETSATPQNETAKAAFALVNQGNLNARAGDPLDSPAPRPLAPLKNFNGANGANGAKNSPETGFVTINEPAKSQESTTGFYTLTSTLEEVEAARDFTARQLAGMTPGQKEHARKLGRCFSLMQYRSHKETGEVMLTQEQIDNGLAALEEQGLLDRYAVIFHDKDVEGGHQWHLGTPPTNPPKPLHMHAAILLRDGRMRIGQVARLFDLPPSRVEIGGDKRRGRWAAEQGFFDLCQYLVHENLKNQERRDNGELYDYPYPRSEVRANFDFSEFLDGGLPGGGTKKETMAERRRHLRRLVGQQGMTLEEACAEDYDAYADDLPRLRQLHADYLLRRGTGVGDTYSKATVLITGPSRTGKDVIGNLVSEIALRIAAQAGQEWRLIKPASKNATEDVAGFDIAQHEEVRYRFTPSYEDLLRYTDPYNAPVQEGRFNNRAPSGPRLISMTTSCTPTELALTVKMRKAPERLAQQVVDAQSADRTIVPIDVDEFLYRLGFLVEVWRPEPRNSDDPIEMVKEQVVARIFKVRQSEASRVENVRTYKGVLIGKIKTQHQLELIAMVKGAERAATFIVMELLRTHSPDVVAALPELFQQWQMNEVPQLAMTPEQTAHEYEQRMLALVPGCLNRIFDEETVNAMRKHMIEKHLHGTSTPYPVDLFWYGEVRGFVYCRGEGEPCGDIHEVKPTEADPSPWTI